MSDEILPGGIHEPLTEPTPTRRLIPMQVGKAIIYIDHIGGSTVVEADDLIYPVAPPDPKEAFKTAMDALKECVHAVGEQIEKLAEKARPQELTVEFSLTFDVKGKASPIPVLVTGEIGTQTGLKVTAIWRRPEAETN